LRLHGVCHNGVMDPHAHYAPETAGAIMSTTIPVCRDTDSCGDALKELAKDIEWDDIHHLYIVNDTQKLLGYVRIAAVVQQPARAPLKQFLKPFPETLSVNDDQETAVFMAVKNDLDATPVIDTKGHLAGAITAKKIIDIMHNEHVEDVLFATGISRSRDTNFIKLASARLIPVLRSRAPWLVVGAFVGISLGLVSSHFEAALEKTLALAYFIPVVAYIADSVGTQSEAITVRALATLKINYGTYLLRELTIGFMLGIILGTMGWLGALVIGGDASVALVVGLSLVAASTVATGLAALIPITFKLIGKDPALGSGPIATALQDILSIAIYFAFALLIIGA
jgi:magnesium transporter